MCALVVQHALSLAPAKCITWRWRNSDKSKKKPPEPNYPGGASLVRTVY
jgi:hypothetical protein